MQTGMRNVAEHLIFPHQQFAKKRKRGKTLYSLASAKVHSHWEGGEKTHARQCWSQMSTWPSL